MEGLTAVLSGGETIHTESMQFSDCTGTYSETVVRGGDGVMDWFEVTVARERSKTVSMQCSAAVQGGGMLNNCQVYKVSQNVEEQHEAVKVNWSNSNTMVFNMQGFFGVQHSD